MKKYILISKKYTGEIVFIFVEGTLAMFDIRGAELSDRQRTWVLEHLPRDEKALELYNSKFTITAVEQAVSKVFVRCEIKDNNGEWKAIPLGMTEA